MKAPVPMLKAAGGSKPATVLALLAGLVVMTAMVSKQHPPKPPPGR